jgi:photosystem II stability/assembly factor-like uncharacterized protein
MDGGKRWKRIFGYGGPGLGRQFNKFQFINDVEGFLINGRGIYRTDNSGKSWDEIIAIDSSHYNFDKNDIGFKNEQVGWIVGSGNWDEDSSGATIYGTLNGGENWQLIWTYPNTDIYDFSLESIHFISWTGWAVGLSGLIVKYTEQNQWQVQTSFTDLPLRKVFFSDEQHGWIAGGYYNEDNVDLRLFKTKDGGENWQENKIDFQINDIFFEDSLHGWAVGNDTRYCGTVLESYDGGDKWDVQIDNLSATLNALHFKDGYGWAVGDNGLFLRTENGASWVANNSLKSYPSKFYIRHYPNPFNPSTTIEFTLPKSEIVTLKIFNLLGEEVATLVNGKLQAGNHSYQFEGSNLASGLYMYRIEAGGWSDVKKMILIK